MQRCKTRGTQTKNVRSFETSQTRGGGGETIVRTLFGRSKRVWECNIEMCPEKKEDFRTLTIQTLQNRAGLNCIVNFYAVTVFLCCCIITPTCIVLLFCRNCFIDLYCPMFIRAVEFMLRSSREIVYVTQFKGNSLCYAVQGK